MSVIYAIPQKLSLTKVIDALRKSQAYGSQGLVVIDARERAINSSKYEEKLAEKNILYYRLPVVIDERFIDRMYVFLKFHHIAVLGAPHEQLAVSRFLNSELVEL